MLSVTPHASVACLFQCLVIVVMVMGNLCETRPGHGWVKVGVGWGGVHRHTACPLSEGTKLKKGSKLCV